MAKKNELLSLSEIIKKFVEYFDSNPMFKNNRGILESYISNPSKIGYDNIIDMSVHERFIEFKYRVPEQLIEYHLLLIHWNMKVDYNIWNDNKDQSSDDWFLISNSSTLIDNEAQYFQKMTQEDNTNFNVSELVELKTLMLRIYQYFNIIPAKMEA